MEFLFFLFAIVFAIYTLVTFKKKTNNSYVNRYFNSKYYRLIILLILTIIAFIISILRKIFI